ncbi:SusC/RagA family TonB-linked outer membrane protein [Zunongwangia sp. F363]|uniref:SusC/RagA family TonB-linked outer membrane protein n=1 Tax=Autumnicola tepida TaxID=3075595 RepID=A0ABU3CEU6_9FLAO|nr:SusC/RagA family TonB-linked outer membrane protein [Zunongwangia sp. F363]MDT0644515.1 SusC/RagA family TonB-linked outer membrane protein [Zunongwangia sp. F363]
MKNNYKRWKFLAWIIVAIIIYILAVPAHAAVLTTKHTPQQQQITGTVTGEDNLPLPGVTVSVKGEARGTVTSFEGEYSITAGQGETLVFSFLGYKRQEIPVGNQTEINVQLEEDVNALDAVKINAGYYNTTRRESTGNISRVTAEEIENLPVVSPIQALQGRMAGVSVVQRSGIPGTASQIQIRGQNSLRTSFENNGNLPLYIIDGIPIDSGPIHSFSGMTSSTITGLDPLNSLNLSNIESIEVLKDADATAIYGSRGANGVILITTKNGNEFGQRTEVTARVYSGVSEVARFIDILHTPDYLALRKEAFANDGENPTPTNAEDLLLWSQERDTDWQKVLFGGTAETTNADINISGGNRNTSFRLSGGYFKTGTVFPGDFGYKKWTTGLALNHRNKDDRFNAQLSVNYGIDVNKQFNSSSFISDALALSPNAPALYNDDGSLNWENSTWTNPLAVTLNTSTANVQQLISSLGISYEIIKDLKFKTNAGYTMLDNDELVKNPVEAYDPRLWDRAQARSSHSLTNRNSWIIEPQLQYNSQIKELKLDALIGSTFQERRSKNLRMSGVGYSNEQLVGNLASAGAVYVSDNREIIYKYNAVFARLGLNFKDRYLLNLTGRRDGSSRFGPDKRFANFGAIGAAWIFSEEGFIRENSWLSFGKIRGSYGITGSDQIQDYGYLDTFSPTPAPGGLYPTQLVNSDYSWETNKKLEAATELGFFENRVRLQLSWYRNRSSNQLVGYTLPAITGFGFVQANLPATVQNTGWEIEGSSINLQSDNWRWETSFNITLPETKLVAFPGIEETSYANIYQVGQPLSISMLYRFNGVDPETGLFQVEDVNQDGTYDYEDRVVIKDLGRQYFGGLQNQVSYKNLNLSFLLEFVGQEGAKFYRTAPGRMANVLQEDFDNRWQAPGDLNVTQKASQSTLSNRAYRNALSSDYITTDASFVRLKSLALSYRLPISSEIINSSRLFLQGQNLYTFTGYKGLDPEVPGSIELPALRTITAGVEINF